MRSQTDKVRPKKFLGQHFLHDQHIAQRIVDSLVPGSPVLEIGPGMGVLTRFLAERKDTDLRLIEIDRDSVRYLREHYPLLSDKIIEGDFLKLDLDGVFPGTFSVIGNFPYNISSQIFFRVLECRQKVDQVVCMLQKEVADRIATKPGSKTYGILSVLLQAYFDIDYLFKVSPGVFTPPPKVMSAVIRLRRNGTVRLDCNEELFVQVVKQAFNMRRKTLRNALKNLILPAPVGAQNALPTDGAGTDPLEEMLNLRAEQLPVGSFVYLTNVIEQRRGATATGGV